MVQTSDWISYRSTCDYSPFGIFLQQQYLILYDETISSADSREKKKKKVSYLSVTELHTQTKTHGENTHAEAGSGTTEVLWVAVMLLAVSISV